MISTRGFFNVSFGCPCKISPAFLSILSRQYLTRSIVSYFKRLFKQNSLKIPARTSRATFKRNSKLASRDSGQFLILWIKTRNWVNNYAKKKLGKSMEEKNGKNSMRNSSNSPNRNHRKHSGENVLEESPG